MISVVLSDDHHIVRQGLRKLLEGQPEVRVIGEAADGAEAVRLVEQLRPDVLVVDIIMGGMNGIEVTRQVKRLWPKTRVVVLSMHAEEEFVADALRAGARAYVLKDSVAGDLLLAVREAFAGRRYLTPRLLEHCIEGYLQQEGPPAGPLRSLTLREREVLHLVAQGLSNIEMAARLCVSRRTIEGHRAHMMKKLGLRNQAQLLRYALDAGIAPAGRPGAGTAPN